MKLIEKIEDVSFYSFLNEKELFILFLKEVINNKNILTLTKNGKIVFGKYLIEFLDDFILIQVIDSMVLEIFNKKGEFLKELNENFNLMSLKKNKNGQTIIANRKTKTFWVIDNEGKFFNTENYFQFHFLFCNQYIKIENQTIIKSINEDNSIKWQINISNIDVLNLENEEKNNCNKIALEIDLHCSEEFGLIYVPLTGKQLLAINAENGEIVWVKQYKTYEFKDEYSLGNLAIKENYIYKHDGFTLSKIDAQSGEIVKTVIFTEIPALANIYNRNDVVFTIKNRYLNAFNASSPVVINDDFIIIWYPPDSNIAIFKTENLEFYDFVHIPNVTGVAHMDSVVSFHNNKLYVKDIDNTLHIFEKE